MVQIHPSSFDIIKTAFTRCRHILKTMKNVTDAKFELAFTRCRNNFKTVQNLPVKSSLQDFDAKKCTLCTCKGSFSLVPKASENVLFSSFSIVYTIPFLNMPIRVPFSKPTVFKICRQKMCRFRVNRRPIRRIFHRFQNVPASCERSLKLTRAEW